MISCIRNCASDPVTVFTGIVAASGGALFAALYSQLALGLDPCVLCLYQRIPYFAAMILGAIGLTLRNNPNAVKTFTALCAVAFVINTGIATYHSGVERHWWVSEVEGCAVPDFAKDPTLLQKILTEPAAHCDVISWADPWLGLTMANYNIIFSLGLFAGCVIALVVTQRPRPLERP